MNIVFFTQEDPFYVKVFFNAFFQNYKYLDEIKAVVISKPMGKKSTLKLAKQMFDFYGIIDFYKVGVKYTYKKLMGKQSMNNRSGNIRTYTVKQLVESYGFDVIERSDLNSPEFHELISAYDADLFISVASPIIFKEKLINIPRLDTINVHNAPLPHYRGMLPNFWQLYHGEREAGITVHRIETGIDTGDVLARESVPIAPGDTLHDMIVKTKMLDVKLIFKVIEDFRHGRVQYTKMESGGSYYSFPTRKDVREFRKRGRSLMGIV